jgi:uncharacterized membrane protein HdeD (DUF308 family)
MSSVLTTDNDVRDMLGALGRNWGWGLAFGILWIVAGLVAIFLPGPTVVVLAILFGAQIVVAGVFRFVSAFSMPENGWLRALNGVLAILAFAVGIYLLAHPFISVLVLAFTLGIFWIIYGVTELFVAIERSELSGRGWLAFTGVLSIVAGVVVTFWPVISLQVLAIVLGAWLVVLGILTVIMSFRLRSVAHKVVGAREARPSPVAR